MSFSARIGIILQVMRGDQWTFQGQTIGYVPADMRILNADRRNAQVWILSAGLSAQQLDIAPLGVSAVAGVLFFMSDQPVDIRTNAASDVTFLSGVQQMALAANLSGFFVTTGSQATTIYAELFGGSNATVIASLPLS